MNNTNLIAQEINDFQGIFSQVEGELHRLIVGMEDVVRGTLSAIFAGGHVLLEGVPGLGKTVLVKSIAKTLGLDFKRIQFTPDLMPSDITGTQMLSEDERGKRSFVFNPGPLFANIVLADELNRATPKTQSALLEAMEERQITVLNSTYPLSSPFFVLATQNPIELEGTYPLPEAQLDRFLVKLLVPSPTPAQLKEILIRTTGAAQPEIRPSLDAQAAGQIIQNMRRLVRSIFVPEPLQEALVRMLTALTPGSDFETDAVKGYVKFGPGPRGAQAVMMYAKVQALLDGRANLAFADLKAAILPCLRHRLILNFQAQADRVSADEILTQVRDAT